MAMLWDIMTNYITWSEIEVRSSIYLYSESPSAHSRYIVSALT